MYSKPFRDICKKTLNEGREILALDTGIISKIYDDKYEIIAVESKTNVFQANEVFDLQDTYCRDVYMTGKSMAITESEGVSAYQKHPLYMALCLEAYICSPIIIDDHVWGTVNFTSLKFRKKPFSQEDISLVEQYAKSIADSVESQG